MASAGAVYSTDYTRSCNFRILFTRHWLQLPHKYCCNTPTSDINVFYCLMNKSNYSFSYTIYDSIDDLSKEDAWLLQHARETSRSAYAPYSHFQVGAAARLINGEMVKGTNQENASYPVGICAERVLLSAAAV